MITLSKAQMSVLRAPQQETARDRIEEHLLTEHEEATGPLLPAQLEAIIDDGMARAAVYGLVSERDVAWFVAMLLEVSPRFDRQPRIHALLAAPAQAGVDRVQRLLEDTTEDDWTQAAAS